MSPGEYIPNSQNLIRPSEIYWYRLWATLMGSRYNLLAYVVMDDHVHVLVEPFTEEQLQQIIQSWKSFTANKMQREYGRRGAVWQDEYFDRIMRDEAEFLEKAEYIFNNPIKRWPELENYRWLGWKMMD